MLDFQAIPMKERDRDRLIAWLAQPEAEFLRTQIRFMIADHEVKGFTAMVDSIQHPARETDAHDHAQQCDELHRLLALLNRMGEGKFEFVQLTPTFSHTSPYDDSPTSN